MDPLRDPTPEELAEAHERLRDQLRESLAELEHRRSVKRERQRRYRAGVKARLAQPKED